MHDRLVSRRIDALHQCFLVIIIIDRVSVFNANILWCRSWVYCLPKPCLCDARIVLYQR